MSVMETRGDPRQWLAARMEERRLELRLYWSDVADRAGVTTEALRQVRQGQHGIKPMTKTGIEQGLRWERGSVDAVLEGGDPTPLPATGPIETVQPSVDPYMERLAALGLDDADRTMIERMLADPEWAEAGRSAIELGEQRGASALRAGLDDIREEMGEQRRQRQRGINRITRMLRMGLNR